tara:strand:- start:1388 stop:1567 length:180 start_codon:yes stop_codon:yes gene_type:complete
LDAILEKETLNVIKPIMSIICIIISIALMLLLKWSLNLKAVLSFSLIDEVKKSTKIRKF